MSPQEKELRARLAVFERMLKVICQKLRIDDDAIDQMEYDAVMDEAAASSRPGDVINAMIARKRRQGATHA